MNVIDHKDARFLGHVSRCLAIIWALSLTACGSTLKIPFNPLPAPAILQPINLSDIKDKRGDFRHTLCEVVNTRKGSYLDERPCTELLHDLGGESAATGSVPAKIEHHTPTKILIVPGIFGECVSGQVTPFSDGLADENGHKTSHPYAYLEKLGYEVDVIPVRGRASSEANAPQIKEVLLKSADSNERIIIVAYSKGVPDTLEALRQLGSDGIPKNLKAVVSVAGVVTGTPIADRMDSLYETVLSHIPMPGCSTSATDPVASLSRAERLKKLPAEVGAIPESVLLYSIVAFTREDNVTTALRPFYGLLANSDPRNDGQIMYYDAVLPRSRLLGYANSDHWAIALAFNRANKPAWRKLVDHNAFPREVLLEAVLMQIEADAAISAIRK